MRIARSAGSQSRGFPFQSCKVSKQPFVVIWAALALEVVGNVMNAVGSKYPSVMMQPEERSFSSLIPGVETC